MSLCSHGLPTRTHQEPDDYPSSRSAARLPSAPWRPPARPPRRWVVACRNTSRPYREDRSRRVPEAVAAGSPRKISGRWPPGQTLFSINTTNGGRTVIFAAGIPLTRNGEGVGAIGISGGTVDQDHEVAEAGVAAFD